MWDENNASRYPRHDSQSLPHLFIILTTPRLLSSIPRLLPTYAAIMQLSILSTCALFLGSTLASPAEVSMAHVRRAADDSALGSALSLMSDMSSSAQSMVEGGLSSGTGIISDMTDITGKIQQLNTDVAPTLQSIEVSLPDLPSISDLLADLVSFLQSTQSIVNTVLQTLPAIESSLGAVVTNLENAFGSLQTAVGSIVSLGQTALQTCVTYTSPDGICAGIQQDIAAVQTIIGDLEKLWNDL